MVLVAGLVGSGLDVKTTLLCVWERILKSYFIVCVFLFFFFFQAEDGIRDWSVTGVQTCALPISLFALLFTTGLCGQTLVSATFLATQSKAEVTDAYNLSNTPVSNGIHLFKITYTTLDIKGQPDTDRKSVV